MVASLALLLGGCQGGGSAPGSAASGPSAEQIRLMQTINQRAQQCWRRDREFASYRFIPELDTRAGRPRLLIVRANAAQGLPQYVIQADGTPAKLAGFGPLADGPLASRIESDLGRWTSGDERCRAA